MKNTYDMYTYYNYSNKSSLDRLSDGSYYLRADQYADFSHYSVSGELTDFYFDCDSVLGCTINQYAFSDSKDIFIAEVYGRATEGSISLFSISSPTAPIHLDSNNDFTYTNTTKLIYDDVNSKSWVLNRSDSNDSTNGVAAIDISNSSDIVNENFIPTLGTPLDAAVNNAYLYLADGNAGLEVFDISDSENSVLLGRYLADGIVTKVVQVSINEIWVVVDDRKIISLDVSDPESIFENQIYNISGGPFLSYETLSDIKITNDKSKVLLVFDGALQIIRTSDMSMIGSYRPSESYSSEALAGNIRAFDISDDATKVYVATDEAYGCDIYECCMYFNPRVITLDVSDPNNIIEENSIDIQWDFGEGE